MYLKLNYKNNISYSLNCFLLISVVFFFLIACDGNSNSSNNTNTNKSENKSTSTQQDVPIKKNEVLKFENNNLTLLLDYYLSLKNALVDDNFIESKNWVTKIVQLNKNEPLFKILDGSINKMVQTSDVSDLRDNLNTLSEEVFELVKSANLSSGTLYKQFCPMAMNNKGAFWLSIDKEIRNPYFGEKMLKCGVTKETI